MLGLQIRNNRCCFTVGMNLCFGKMWVLNKAGKKMFTLINRKGCFSLHFVLGYRKKEITCDIMGHDSSSTAPLVEETEKYLAQRWTIKAFFGDTDTDVLSCG